MWQLLLVLALAESPFSAATSADDDQNLPSFTEIVPPSMKPFSAKENGTGFVRGMRSADDLDVDGVWASAPVMRLDSREKPTGTFWPNRGRREMEGLLEAIYSSVSPKEGKESLGAGATRSNRAGLPTPFDELRSMMRLALPASPFIGSLLRNKLKLHQFPASDYESNQSHRDDEGFELASDSWPERAHRRASNEVQDPFLANRGRGTDEEDEVLANMVREVDDSGTFWPNRGREVGDQDTFWPNRGREVREETIFYPNRGREVEEENHFYPNRGREVGLENPFYPNRGREVGLENPFYPNRGRDVGDTANDFWANRGRGLYDDPYWAKRARGRLDDLAVSFSGSDDPTRVVSSTLKQRVRMRDVLYAELPTWIPLERRRAGLTGIASKDDPFWISRGRRAVAGAGSDTRLRRGLNNRLAETFYPARGRRGLKGTLSAEEQFWPLRGRRDLKDSLSTEEHFWPLRGRRGLKESLASDEHFWPLRGRRGLKDSLASNEHFWPVRGRRGLRESLSKDEHFWPVRGRRDALRSLPKDDLFWPVRGKKSEGIEQVWRGRRIPTESTAARTLGNLQDPNFWPVRGKRPRESENEEDDAFWEALEKRSNAKKELSAVTSTARRKK